LVHHAKLSYFYLAEYVGREVDSAERSVGGEHSAKRLCGQIRYAVRSKTQLNQRSVARRECLRQCLAAGVKNQIVTQDDSTQGRVACQAERQ